MSSASPLRSIRAASWEPYARKLKHVFLAGNLQRPVPHPFLRRTDLELVIATYAAGDDSLPHWHREIEEIDFVISGHLGYQDILRGTTEWFGPGDLINIDAGVCVRRLVPEATRTLTIKLPSADDKVHCRDCPRPCDSRLEAFVAP